MKITVLSLALIAISLVSCKSMKDDSSDANTTMKFEVLQSGILSGGGSEGIEESIVVCNSKEDLKSIKEKMNSVNPSTGVLDDMKIDFEKETVIGYFQPVRSSGGYTLEAKSLNQVSADGGIYYFMHYYLSTPQGAATASLTQPFIFVKTQKIKGTVKYKVEEQPSL